MLSWKGIGIQRPKHWLHFLSFSPLLCGLHISCQKIAKSPFWDRYLILSESADMSIKYPEFYADFLPRKPALLSKLQTFQGKKFFWSNYFPAHLFWAFCADMDLF
jgi:hypothetical protein